MLKKHDGPNGRYWLRKKFDPKDYQMSQRELAELAKWRDQGTLASLLAEHNGPFEPYMKVGEQENEGKKWVRFCSMTFEYCFDVEVLPNGKIGTLQAVSPEEAWRLARERDAKPDSRVVLED